MKVTFITPQVGRKKEGEYVKTWQMAPLTIATLVGLTPKDVEVEFFDERIEKINFDTVTDLVAITVETYTAKRAYEISREFNERGAKTILGGFHVSLMPDEAELYADSILIGYAEPLWQNVVRDAEKGLLKRRYTQDKQQPYEYVIPNREIFKGKSYFDLAQVETGRGCPLHCNFCSIAAVTTSIYYSRPIDSILAEISGLETKRIFFVEDNFFGNPKNAKELCKELIPLKIKWVGQGTLSMANDEKFLELLAQSGCMGMLIGFESIRQDTLLLMDKKANTVMGDYIKRVKTFHKYGIALYGAFVLGYDTESIIDIKKTADIAIEMQLFIAAFNHLVPFPGTPLYNQFKLDGRLNDEEWWLSPTFRFGDISFNPKNLTADALHNACLEAREQFYSYSGIIKRARNVRGNLTSFTKGSIYFFINGLLRKEIRQRDGIPLGNEPFRPEPIFQKIDLNVRG